MTLLAGSLKTKMALAALGLGLALSPVMAEAKGDRGARASFEELDANSDGQITQAEMEAHRVARMASADTNGDGSLTREELSAQMKKGSDERATKRIDRMLERLDANKDGALSTQELTQAAEKRQGRGFSRIDTDGNGSISKAEFEQIKKRHGGKKRGN